MTKKHEVQATVDLSTSLLITLTDPRSSALSLFEPLDPSERCALATDAWSIGLRAVTVAYQKAEETRLGDIGAALRNDVQGQLDAFTKRQVEQIGEVLARYFDPRSGVVAERLDAFVRDDGELMRRLHDVLGPTRGPLAETLAKAVGENSPLFRKLDPGQSDGVVQMLKKSVEQVLAKQEEQTRKLLDPLASDGPLSRMFETLRKDLMRAKDDQLQQIALATAAIDANKPESLLNGLVRKSQEANERLFIAMNADSPDSPFAGIKSTLTGLLREHFRVQQEGMTASEATLRTLGQDLRMAVERLDTRKRHDAQSPRGGVEFEEQVTSFVQRTFVGSGMTVEATRNTQGDFGRRKVGDIVARFTEESAYVGAALVLEVKHDKAYSEKNAVDELATARKNRAATAGLFVMAQSHAGPDFPRFARHGVDVLVVWDPEDSTTNPYLHAALLLGQCLAAKACKPKDEASLRALEKVEADIQAELVRHAKMKKCAEAIENHAETLLQELGRGTKALTRLVDRSHEVLRALKIDPGPANDTEPVHGSRLAEQAGAAQSVAAAVCAAE